MPIQYRRRLPVRRGTWLNVSKSGVSVSRRLAGVLTLNSRGGVRLRGPIRGLFWRSGR